MACVVNENPSYRRGHAGSVSGTVVAETQEEVIAWKKEYLSLYDPAGYDTTVSEPKQDEEGRWIIYYHRRLSCS